MTLRGRTGCGLILVMAGCASTGTTSAQMTRTAAAVESAESASRGASDAAVAYAALARRQLVDAKKREAEGEYEEAEALALQARQDAELASIMARDEQTRGRLVSLARTMADEPMPSASTGAAGSGTPVVEPSSSEAR